MSDKKNIAIFSLGILLVFSSCKNAEDRAFDLDRGVLDTMIINRDSIRHEGYKNAQEGFLEKKMFLYTSVGSDSNNLVENPKIITQFYKDRMGIDVTPSWSIIDCGNTSYNAEYSEMLYQQSYQRVFDSITTSCLGNGIYLKLKKYRDSLVVAEMVKKLLEK